MPWTRSREKQPSQHRQRAPALRELDPGQAAISDIRRSVQALAVGAEPPVRRPALRPVDGEIENCWNFRRQLQSLKSWVVLPSLRTLLAHKALKRAIRERKRARTLETLDQAEQAAKAGQTKTLFKVLKQLCPGRSVQRVKLRDPDGWLLSAEAECEVLVKYASELFGGAGFPKSALRPLDPELLCDARWIEALREIKAEIPSVSHPYRHGRRTVSR